MFLIHIGNDTLLNVELIESIKRYDNGDVVVYEGEESYSIPKDSRSKVWDYFNSIAMVPGEKEQPKQMNEWSAKLLSMYGEHLDYCTFHTAGETDDCNCDFQTFYEQAQSILEQSDGK